MPAGVPHSMFRSLPPPRVRPAKVIYLDFDCMLHPEVVLGGKGLQPRLSAVYRGHKLFEHGELLAQLLEPYPDVAIVLSTSWVRLKGLRQLREAPADEPGQALLGRNLAQRASATRRRVDGPPARHAGAPG